MSRFLLSAVLATGALALAACDEQKITEDYSAPPVQQSAIPAPAGEVQPAGTPRAAGPLVGETEVTPNSGQ